MGYTWGELRYQLQVGAEGFNSDLIDSWLNLRYAEMLDHFPWKGLEVETYLETVASYTTGTLTATLGSNAVVGVGTTWTAGMTGYRIQVSGRSELYVFTYASATTGTLDRVFEGATLAGAGFTLFQNIYTLPADLKTLLGIDAAVDGVPLQEFSKQALSDAIAARVLVGDPRIYAIDADTAEGSSPVLHAVELYPLPQSAQGLPLRYLKAAQGFNGDAPSGAPLPFVSVQCLLHGVRAEIAAWKGNLAAAQAYEAKAAAELATMVRIDATRRGPKRMRLEPGYVSYRQRRVCR